MRILFLPKYSAKAPSSRYRTHQYLSYFQNAGFSINNKPLFDDSYINSLYAKKRVSILKICSFYIKRIWLLLGSNKYDLVYIEKEAFPYVPFFVERFFLPSKFILDYDDAIFHAYTHSSSKLIRVTLENKIPQLMRLASAIVTGSPYLTDYAKRFNLNTYEIPTSIDWDKYTLLPIKQNEPESFIIGWIGSPTTSKYLLGIEKPLKRFMDLHKDVKLRLVGFDANLKLNLDDERVEILKWDSLEEVKLIRTFDIGIMPLSVDPFSKGKCGFKLIQYMACAVPTISTPLEANVKINEGSNNLFANDDEEWFEKFELIYKNSDYYVQVGEKNRSIAFKRYSIQSNSGSYIEILKNKFN